MRALTAVLAAGAMAPVFAAPTLEQGFARPPDSAKPHTWYHMMNGNVTKEGITCDFEAIARAGLGGVQMFDAGCDIPAGPLKFNSEDWFDMFRHAQKEAKRLGLEICIPNCSGWSSSGGPWNTPAHAMKWTVYTETAAKGPAKFGGKLPRTSRDNGFYEDIAVLAYRTPRAGAHLTNLPFKTFLDRGDTRRDTGAFAADQIVAKDGIVDLTGKMAADGTLAWDVPAGDWTILRIGYVCNGRNNHPASEKGVGLEVDKLSASAMDWHFNQYVTRLCRDLGIDAKTDNATGFNNILVDSYEVGCQNWTQGFDKTFKARMGYDLRPYLPVFAGRVVGSTDESERFLEDFRRVVADLFAENYAGRLTELCHRHGLRCSIEPYGNSMADDLQYGQDIDIPMAEFWSNAGLGDNKCGDVGNSRHAAYLSHVWGRRYAATESFTAGPEHGGRWRTTPFSIKSQGDRAFAAGINRIIYHRYTHQPWPGNKYVPGMTMGRWGMHLDRTQTWWELSPAWFTYQARCQWMLQEGRFAADALYWCGEDAPNGGGADIGLPPGYAWDVCATKAVEMLKVKDGRVVAPGGVSYALLVLPSTDTMSEKMLARVGELLDQGAKICARTRPTRAPGLRGYPAADARVKALVEKVWAKGVMACGPAEALKRLGVAEDVATKAADFSWIHRSSADADWYFVATDNATPVSFEASFRQTGRVPEIWDAVTGARAEAPVWRAENGRTTVRFDFEPSGSRFVVFRRKAAAAPHHARLAARVSPRPEPTKLVKETHTLEIRKAEYGLFPEDLRPDCLNAERYIKPGVSIIANNITFERDPAINKPKRLEVVYRAGGAEKRVYVNEGQAFTLPKDAGLVSAWYGLTDPEWVCPKDCVADVTKQVASRVVDGEITVVVNNNLSGRDPAPNRRKRLRVTYAYDGVETTRMVDEGGGLRIPSYQSVDQPPPEWEWRGDKVLAWQPAEFTVEEAGGASRALKANPAPAVAVEGAWNVAFPAGWDAPASVVFPRLVAWDNHADEGVRYFSGTATYTKRVDFGGFRPGARVMLDLGVVKNFAVVKVNGKAFPVLWKPPFRLDVTDALQPGDKSFALEVKVTNLWANRLIGDDRLYKDDCEWRGASYEGCKEIPIRELPQWVKDGKKSPTGRHTFTTWKHWSKEDALLPSGLIGPVIVRFGEIAR